MSVRRSSGTVSGLGSGDPDNWLSALFRRPSDETVHADDQEFNGTIGGTALTVSGTANWTQDKGVLSVEYHSQGTNDLAARIYSLTPSTHPVTIETCVRVMTTLAGNAIAGVFFSDGTTSTDNQTFAAYARTSSNWYVLNYRGTFDVYDSGISKSIPEASIGVYLRHIWSASNTFKFQFSPDGVSWTDWDEGGQSWTMTPTHFGVMCSTWATSGAGNTGIATFEYLRVTESDLSV